MKARRWGHCPACCSVIGIVEETIRSQGSLIHKSCVAKWHKLLARGGPVLSPAPSNPYEMTSHGKA